MKELYIVKVLIKMTYRPDTYEIERYEYDRKPSKKEIEMHLRDLKHWEDREGYEGKIFAEVLKIYRLEW